MSMHFAPQWVKPIKPTGTSITPTAEHPTSHPNKPSSTSQPSVPFPALSSNGQLHGNHNGHGSNPSSGNPPLSYSRATHTPTTPGFPHDSSYFPYTAEANGHAPMNGNSHPFRYSRDQMLGLWDEEKVRNVPIELVEMLENGGLMVSKNVIKPIGLRDLTDAEKKVLSGSIHPPMPTRRPQTGPTTTDPTLQAGQMSRRTIGTTGGKDVSTPGRGPAGGAFGAFGSGKIGTIGGGLLSPGAGPGETGRAPGALGGGFGGVGRRTARRTESSGEPGPWRTTRTASGSFEGVLGFGGIPAPQQPQQQQQQAPQERNVSGGAMESIPGPQSPWKEKAEPKDDEGKSYGSGGGPGWGTGQKKWRIAAGLAPVDSDKPQPQTLELPVVNHEISSPSVAASASATPMTERDAQIQEVSAPSSATPIEPAPTTQEKEDLGAVEWFYRDPEGQEQGPFAGSQMHEWYSHSYFTDDLPLRRSSEKSFHTLAELKTATGNAVQPFLSAVRPRLPPNLPLPLSTAQSPVVNGMTEAMRNMGMVTPTSLTHTPQQTAPYNQYIPDRNVISPAHFAPQQNAFAGPLPSPGGSYMPSPSQWGVPQPRLSTFGPVGVPSPIGSAPLHYAQQPQNIYSPVIGGPGPIGRDGRDFFSPSIGAGAHPHPAASWGPQNPQHAYAQQPQQPLPMAPWQTQQPEMQHPQPMQQQSMPPAEMPSQPLEAAAPPAPMDEPSYFPQGEEADRAIDEELAAVDPAAKDLEQTEEPETVEKDVSSEETDPTPATPVQEPPAVKSDAKPPVSVWGQKPSTVKTPGSAPSSRKSSIAGPTAPVQPTSKLPPAPSSLPPKPVSAAEATSETPSTPADKPAPTPKPAPWADKEVRTPAAGPSLREIQEAEAKEAESRRAARAAAASPAPAAASSDDIPQNLTWGLPTSQKAAIAAPVAASPPPPAWGSGDAGPKKTLKQIQEEEEKKRVRAAQAAKAQGQSAATPGASAGPKRGYADLAATSQPPGAGWTTVGAKPVVGAAASPAPRTASSVLKPAAATPSKPATPAAVKPKADESVGPSIDFIRWTKQSLTGLNVNIDEFIQMLLSFPIDPPAADRPGVLEIISDSVYANSSTLDGRRFAQEFFTKRKADAARPKGSSASVVGKSSLADVVKSVPKKQEDAGFRVVKAKGKKKN